MKKFYGIIVIVFSVTLFACSVLAEPIKLTMVSCWSSHMTNFESDKRFAKSVYELSGGRLQISVNAAGTLVAPMSVFDQVSRGAYEVGSDTPAYWSGKNSAFDLFASFPMGLSQHDVINWYFHAGGQDMVNYVYGKYNMIYFITSVAPAGSGIRSRMPIRSISDYKGKKIRMSGKAQGYILNKLGAAQVMLAGNEIYQALQMGTIDGAEFASPSIDWSMGLGEVTKYSIGPGWHQPSSVYGIMINREAWNRLPADLKKIIEVAANENIVYMSSWYETKNMDAFNYFSKRNEIARPLSDKDLTMIENWAWEYLLAEARRNPDYDKVATSMFQYLKDFRMTRDSQKPFSQGRTPGSIPKLPNLK